jgi:IS1 family transposase
MNRLTTERRTRILAALVEGMSVRATCRMTDSSKGAVLRLLAEIGEVCAAYQDETMRNLPCKRVQADEIWSFCHAKDKNLPASMKGKPGVGSIWTWTAICADTKLVPSWHVGTRDAGCAYEFMVDLASRLRGRVQLTTDGHGAYLVAVPGAFGRAIDYAQLVKIYGVPADAEKRYSPAECLGARVEEISGNPDPEHISTSYVERQNLTMRMGMRRFTRLTNGFSKKIENHRHNVALHFMHHNFARIHQTLRCTPAMEAGVADHPWTIEEIVGLLEAKEAQASPAPATTSK